MADNPKWNLFRNDKNVKTFCFCSKEMISKLRTIDDSFVYPLMKHRSHLVHTANDVGNFNLSFNLNGDDINPKFFATELFKNNFRNIVIENDGADLTIRYAAVWLIDQTLKTSTEILFELREDMMRNKKIEHG